ncbi:MAG: GNAT family N-acetyltransferase [Erysipelotrichaceae bacterium]|nr:GNAT family N-acetyltransferase [Erysipelotrichaceae bacterium]
MLRLFRNYSNSNDEITISLAQKFGPEPDVGIEKTYCFNIYLNDKNMRRIGYVDLRVGENEFLYYLGHIGYRINEEYRGHHYAAQAVELVLPFARKQKMKHLIITCNPDNIASKKTIENLHADYLETVKVPEWHELYGRDEKMKCIYEITL